MPVDRNPYDVRLSVTDPPDTDLRRIVASGSIPDQLVVGCFFRDTDQRREFLDGLRRTAALAAMPDRTAARSQDAAIDDETEVGRLRQMVRQRAESGLGYHAYSLKIAVPPYSASCLVSFEMLDPESIRRHIASAQGEAEAHRRRMLDVFGLSREDDAG